MSEITVTVDEPGKTAAAVEGATAAVTVSVDEPRQTSAAVEGAGVEVTVSVDEPSQTSAVVEGAAVVVTVTVGGPSQASAGSGATPFLDVVVFANTDARLAYVPARIGQRGYQTDEATFWVAYGRGVGQWKFVGAGELTRRVDDAGDRGDAIPAFAGQFLYQDDTEVWYEGTAVTAGAWSEVTTFSAGMNVTAGDIIAANRLLWICIEAVAVAPAWAEPGAGAGWQRYWEPFLVQGYHWDYSRDPSGSPITGHVVVSNGELLPDWHFALNWLIVDKLPYNGGGSNNAAWLDGTPLALPAAWSTVGATYTSGQFKSRSGVTYKCHTGHTSTGTGATDAPGTGATWEDYWIEWTEDARVAGALEFSGGNYYTSGVLRQPPSVTIFSEPASAQRHSSLIALAGYSDTYLLEGIKRDNVNANANFWTSVKGLTLNPSDLCKACYWVASHGSVFECEVKNQGRFTPLTLAPRTDDVIITARITDTDNPHIRSPYGIYCEGSILATSFRNCVIGRAAVGISFENVEGCIIENLETESTALPVEVRIRDNDSAYTVPWATFTAIHRGDRLLVGGDRYRCYNPLSAADENADKEPGVGADWQDYFELIADSGVQGRCGGLHIIGGRWLRNSAETTHEEFLIARIDSSTENFDGLTITGLHLDHTGGGTTWRWIALQEVTGGNAIYDYPVDLSPHINRLNRTVDWSSARAIDWNTAGRQAHAHFGSGVSNAETVDGRWVSVNNPGVFDEERADVISLAPGWYDVETLFNIEFGSLTLSDERSNPLPYFSGLDAGGTLRLYHPGGLLRVSLEADPALQHVVERYDTGTGAYSPVGGPFFLLYDGIIYGAPIKADGSKKVTARQIILATGAQSFKEIRVAEKDDDHSMGSLVIRPDVGEIVLLNTDHNDQNDIFLYRGTSLDIQDIPTTPTATLTGSTPTFATPYLNPAVLDELNWITRYGSSTAAAWNLARTSNLNDPIPTINDYELAVETHLVSTHSSDMAGIWLAGCDLALPTTSGPASSAKVFSSHITLWFLDLADDSLNSAGVVEKADVTAGPAINLLSRNNLTDTNDFSDWTTQNVSFFASTISNKFGATSVSVEKVIDNATNGFHRVYQSVPCTSGSTYELSVEVKAAELSKISLHGPVGCMASHGTFTVDPSAIFNSTGGTIVSQTGNLDDAGIDDIGNGWYRAWIIFTPTDTVTDNAYIYLTNASDAISYAGTVQGIYLGSAQHCETPYTNRSFPFTQHKTTNRKGTLDPISIRDPVEGKYAQVLDLLDTGTHVEILWVEFDSYDGSSPLAGRTGTIMYARYTKASDTVSAAFEVGPTGDGLDDATMTFIGGTIMAAWEVLYDLQNREGDTKGRVIRAESTDSGTTWGLSVMTVASGEDVLRPKRIDEVTFAAGVYLLSPSRWFSFMQGDYSSYLNDFNTDIHVARLGTGAPDVNVYFQPFPVS